MLHTTTYCGLHDFVAERVLARYARCGVRAADLVTGLGAMAARLSALGCDALAEQEPTACGLCRDLRGHPYATICG